MIARLDDKTMAELDVIVIHNPTSEDFTQNYNGEPYTIKAKETKHFAQHPGYHIAKHLATRMVSETFSQKERTDPKKAVTITQHLSYDNPRLRIALYKILQDKLLVQEVIMAYPYKSFIGEMKDYEKFVEEEETKRTKPVEDKKDENKGPKEEKKLDNK